MILQSWKWTWSPILLMFDTIKTNMYTAHVLLCADFNEHGGYGYDSPHYLRPHSAKEFYRILGLKMMAYRPQGEYWFESDADKRAHKKRENRQSA